MDICYSIIGFIFGIGLLVIVHELGHFYTARFFGVKILRFSIGFGASRHLWSDKFGTEYVISAIPLGGYVIPLDTRVASLDPGLKLVDQTMAINNKSPWIRILIFLAGPIFSILFAVVLYWVVFVTCTTNIVPILGKIPKGTIAHTSGLKSGLEIIKINEELVYSWEDIASILLKQLSLKSKFINLETYDHKTANHVIYPLNMKGLNFSNIKEDILKTLSYRQILCTA